MQKVLIITYYWPPSGGSGVQRWLKFVKYLPQFGWKPVVFTPENPAMIQQDASLQKDVLPDTEVVRFPIWEPYDAFFKLSSFLKPVDKTVKPSQLSTKTTTSLFHKVTTWVRGNFFIPDPKIFWVKPSVKFLHEYLQQHEIRTIVTTGPPHSLHLIGYGLKKKNPSLNWIADFRDPWSEWPFLDTFKISRPIRKYHARLERKVLLTADHVMTITPFYQQRFEILSGKKVDLITNGFDEDDFSSIQYTRPEKFTIRHVGIVYQMANPKPFIEVLTRLSNELGDFKNDCVVEFIGEVNATFQEAFRQSPVAGLVKFKSPVPHKELLSIYGSTSVLLLNLEGYQHAEGIMPGKMFEYLATGIPIVGAGPSKGDAADALNETKAGKLFDLTDVVGFGNALAELYGKWKSGSDLRKPNQSVKYSRRMLTEKLTGLLR